MIFLFTKEEYILRSWQVELLINGGRVTKGTPSCVLLGIYFIRDP